MSDNGYFGRFGGRYVAEVLSRPLAELADAFASVDVQFTTELEHLRADFIGRPTPLLFAQNASSELGGAQIWIKLEGFAHTGAHKINNALAQALLARRMGKTRIIAETGAGQHGLATAAACARLGLSCTVYMGEVDVRRQQPNVAAMELYGATVVSVRSGSRTLKDAINEAMRDWSASFADTHYLIGSALGPAPYPDMVREFQSVIGRETRAQLESRGVSPTALIACVGGGSNAIGFFAPFLDESAPRLIGVEAGGVGPGPGQNAVRMDPASGASDGIVHGYKSRFLVTGDGQLAQTRSISAGLDYPGIGPQLAERGQSGRIEFTKASDDEALEAVRFFARTEGVMFALESAHAGAVAIRVARQLADAVIVVNMSGRGDKDIFITSPVFRPQQWKEFLRSELERLESGREVHENEDGVPVENSVSRDASTGVQGGEQ